MHTQRMGDFRAILLSKTLCSNPRVVTNSQLIYQKSSIRIILPIIEIFSQVQSVDQVYEPRQDACNIAKPCCKRTRTPAAPGWTHDITTLTSVGYANLPSLARSLLAERCVTRNDSISSDKQQLNANLYSGDDRHCLTTGEQCEHQLSLLTCKSMGLQGWASRRSVFMGHDMID